LVINVKNVLKFLHYFIQTMQKMRFHFNIGQ
jgi:hypothetical protein